MQEKIKVILTNRLATFQNIDVVQHDYLDPYFTYRAPGYRYTRLYKMGVWDGYIHILKNSQVPSGLFLQRAHEISVTEDVKFLVADQRVAVKFCSMPPRVKSMCRPYQRECVQKMVKHSRVGGLILNATGTGKTFIAGAYFSRATGYGVFVVDELTLLAQSQQNLSEVLQEEVGIVGNQQFDPRRITVATVQTIHRHRQDTAFKKWTRKITTVFLDEIHTAMNRRNIQSVRAINPLTVFGLTATLEISKTDIMVRAVSLAGPPIYDYPIDKGMREGHLSVGVVCAVDWHHQGAGGDYQSDYKDLIVHSRSRNDLIEGLVKEGVKRGKFVILILDRIAHLKIFHQRLKRAKIRHRLVYGACSKDARRKAVASMDKGQLQVIVTNRVFSKGVDIQTCDVIIDGTAGRSKNNALQRFGRGVRLSEGKRGLIHFDIGDLHLYSYGDVITPKNRFHVCTMSRRRAFSASNIGIFTIPNYTTPSEIYQQSELRLQNEVDRRVLKPS